LEFEVNVKSSLHFDMDGAKKPACFESDQSPQRHAQAA